MKLEQLIKLNKKNQPYFFFDEKEMKKAGVTFDDFLFIDHKKYVELRRKKVTQMGGRYFFKKSNGEHVANPHEFAHEKINGVEE